MLHCQCLEQASWFERFRRNASKAALALKFTGRDLLTFGVVDEVIPEPLGATHRDHRAGARRTLRSRPAPGLVPGVQRLLRYWMTPGE